MCLIIYCPPHHRPSLKRLMEAHKANSDNFGYLHFDVETFGRYKSLPYHDIDKSLKWCVESEGKLAMHFRTASSGGKSQDQAHPLQITPDLFFMANGNLSHFQDNGRERLMGGRTYHPTDEGSPRDGQSMKRSQEPSPPHEAFSKRSDMQVFRDTVLKPALAKLETEYPFAFFDWLEKYCIDHFTKMVFMDSSGYVRIVNESQGVWDYSDDGGGCWFSNGGIKNYIGYGFSGLYEYGENQIRHKGGLITARFGAGHKWCQCPSCKGWFSEPESQRKPVRESEPMTLRNPPYLSEPLPQRNPRYLSEPEKQRNPKVVSDHFTCPECNLLNEGSRFCEF